MSNRIGSPARPVVRPQILFTGPVEEAVNQAFHEMDRARRISRARSDLALIKSKARAFHDRRQAALLPRPRFEGWLVPGHWSYRAALVVCLAVFVVLFAVLVWGLATYPTGAL